MLVEFRIELRAVFDEGLGEVWREAEASATAAAIDADVCVSGVGLIGDAADGAVELVVVAVVEGDVVNGGEEAVLLSAEGAGCGDSVVGVTGCGVWEGGGHGVVVVGWLVVKFAWAWRRALMVWGQAVAMSDSSMVSKPSW